LGVEAMGVFSLAIAIGGALFGISLYGVRNFQVSDVENKYADNIYIIARILTSAVTLIVCAIFVVLNAYSFFVSTCILVFMLFKISEAFSDVYQGILQKAMRMDYVGKSLIIRGVITLALFVAVLLLTNNLLFCIVILCASSCVIIALYDMRHAKRLSQSIKAVTWKPQTKGLLIECLPIAVFLVIFNMLVQIPRYFIELQMGLEALGYFATIAMPVLIVQASINFVFAPLTTPFAEHLNAQRWKEFYSLLRKTALFILVISVASIILAVLFGEWLLILLFGEMIIPYSYLLLPLVICTILVAISWSIATILVVLRRQRVVMFLVVISLAIVLFGSYPLIGLFALNGANIVLIIALSLFCVGSLIALVISLRRHKKSEI